MKRLFSLLVAACLWPVAIPAFATTIAAIPVTTAVSAQTTTVVQFVDGAPLNLEIQGNFTYGSGGTSVDAWVQTSFDAGVTWADIAEFHFTTSSARFVYNLSSLTPKTTEVTPTDGSLASNTSIDGLLGSMLRVKYTTVGTYAGNTSLNIDVDSRSLVRP